MDYLTNRYINLISNRLRNFRRKGERVWNFSCPFCGDSKTNRKKARGYLYEKNNVIWFTCHNCNEAIGSFDNFLKQFAASAYDDYIREKYQKREEKSEIVFPSSKFVSYDLNALKELRNINELDTSDAVRYYVNSRKIPEKYFDKLFDCPFFKSFTNSLLPKKFNQKSLFHEERRLLIPFFDENKKFFAYAGRSIEKEAYLRYINIVLDETKPKIFGLDRWNKTKPSVVVEGPIDSLFLDNCIASAGGDLTSVLKGMDKEQFTIVYDNEPFSFTTKNKIKKAIDHGFRVCIWPDHVIQKDVNNMILKGYSSTEISNIIKENTFNGLQASLRLAYWSKK
jgi:transcription elongation factor Elf1